MSEELSVQEPVPETVTTENTDAELDKDKDKVDLVEEMEAQQAAEEKAKEALATESKKTQDAKSNSQSDVPPTPPPKPARPLSPFQQAETQLKEAFPSVEPSVIRAVLVASNGQLDGAFNALLSMSDPNFKPETVVKPAVPAAQSQIEEDARLARELAQQYGAPPGRHRDRQYSSSSRVRQQQPDQNAYSGRYDEHPPQQPERSFFDDDLPEIRQNLEKGFIETRDKVTSWMTNLKKKFDNEDNDGDYPGSSGNGSRNGSQLFGALGRSSGEYEERTSKNGPQGYGYEQRRRNRGYDRDPTEINDDFQGISLRDNDSEPPVKPPRPGAVSAFGDSNSSAKQWEPIKKKDASEDKDPFFIGESDDEDDQPLAKSVAAAAEKSEKKGGEKS